MATFSFRRLRPELPDEDPRELGAAERRLRRILTSIQKDLVEGGTARVRQILSGPRALYRVEVERTDLAYLRITVMGADALEMLLEQTPEDTIRERFIFRTPS